MVVSKCAGLSGLVLGSCVLFLLAGSTFLYAQDRPVTEPFLILPAADSVVTRPILIKVPTRRRSLRLTDPRLALLNPDFSMDYAGKFAWPTVWEKENRFGLSLSEVAFVNWNAGGDNAITALGKLRFIRNYKYKYISWQNELEMRFGWNAQEGRQWRKTDDAIRINSTFGYRRDTLSNWYYSAKGSFNSQFADGYKYPDRSRPISRFMAPGYLFIGAGASYISEGGGFNLYLSPLTHRSTFVLDQDLANQGAFGVEKALLDEMGNVVREGENIFTSLGAQITNTWVTPVLKNVEMDHRINLYTDYLRDFGNVDIDWELRFNLKVNEFLAATVGTQIIYDDDIRFDVVTDDDGTILDPGVPRIQLRQWLSIGIDYAF